MNCVGLDPLQQRNLPLLDYGILNLRQTQLSDTHTLDNEQ